jgi:hypothetical protein
MSLWINFLFMNISNILTKMFDPAGWENITKGIRSEGEGVS